MTNFKMWLFLNYVHGDCNDFCSTRMTRWWITVKSGMSNGTYGFSILRKFHFARWMLAVFPIRKYSTETAKMLTFASFFIPNKRPIWQITVYNLHHSFPQLWQFWETLLLVLYCLQGDASSVFSWKRYQSHLLYSECLNCMCTRWMT